MTNLSGGWTIPAARSLRAFQAAGTPSPSGAKPAAARHAVAAGPPRDPPSDSRSPPAPGSRSRTCVIVRLTRKSPIHDPANHGGLVPRIAPLKRLPGPPPAQRSRTRFERITGGGRPPPCGSARRPTPRHAPISRPSSSGGCRCASPPSTCPTTRSVSAPATRRGALPCRRSWTAQHELPIPCLRCADKSRGPPRRRSTWVSNAARKHSRRREAEAGPGGASPRQGSEFPAVRPTVSEGGTDAHLH